MENTKISLVKKYNYKGQDEPALRHLCQNLIYFSVIYKGLKKSHPQNTDFLMNRNYPFYGANYNNHQREFLRMDNYRGYDAESVLDFDIMHKFIQNNFVKRGKNKRVFVSLFDYVDTDTIGNDKELSIENILDIKRNQIAKILQKFAKFIGVSEYSMPLISNGSLGQLFNEFRSLYEKFSRNFSLSFPPNKYHIDDIYIHDYFDYYINEDFTIGFKLVYGGCESRCSGRWDMNIDTGTGDIVNAYEVFLEYLMKNTLKLPVNYYIDNIISLLEHDDVCISDGGIRTDKDFEELKNGNKVAYEIEKGIRNLAKHGLSEMVLNGTTIRILDIGENLITLSLKLQK